MAEEGRKSGVTPEEDLLIGETPAIFSNRFYTLPNPHGTKITFAEGTLVGGKQVIKPRFAVYLVPDDLRALYELIEPIVKSMQSIPTKDAGQS